MQAGPFGQGAAALTLLGTACSTYFGEYNRGTFLTSQSGQTMSSASVLIAFLLLGLDTLLIVIAVYFVLEYAFKRQLSFSMTWWTTIFPLGTVNLGLIALATSLNSPAFGVLASALLVLLVVDFLCCSAFTLRGIVRGGLLSSSEHNEEQDKDD
jgi:tellurite resistance protein TehA-like permease